MSSSDNTVISGCEYVKEVIEHNRFKSGDILVNAEGGECQWLEFKAVARVGSNDKQVQEKCRTGKSLEDACHSETIENLRRIAKAIVSLYNMRGGGVLIGVCEVCGKAIPTVYSRSEDSVNSRFRLLRYFSALSKSIVSIINDLKTLRALNSLFNLKCIIGNGGLSKHVQLDSLFERKIIFYKGIPIIAFIVKWAADRNSVVLYEDEDKRDKLAYRNGAENMECDWPPVVNQRNLFDELRMEAESNNDLYYKYISLTDLKRPNPVMRILDKVVHLFDKSFVASAVSYVLSPVSQDKAYDRLRISFLYYGIYFLCLNALLIWFAGMRLALIIAILIGLVVALCEIHKRIAELNLSIWVLVPSGIFVLLSTAVPYRPWSICVSSVGLVTSLGLLSLMLKNPRLRTDNESALSQIMTLFVYLFVMIVQFPLLLFAISESGRSVVGNYILAFVVNLVPVVSSIAASHIAIVYYDGFFVGCTLMFYSPYVLLFLCAICSSASEIVIVPKMLRNRFSWLCEKVIILSVFGLIYMILVSLGAIREASDKKRWNREISEPKTRVTTSGKKQVQPPVEPPNAEKDSLKERLTINDYFAQAFASYYYCYSNEVCSILSQYDECGREISNRRYNIALNRHYNGLKNIEYSFVGSQGGREFETEDFEEEDYFADFLSDSKLDVDSEIIKLFLEYMEAIRQVGDLSTGGLGDVRRALCDTANEIRQCLFARFETMKLKIDWRYVEWINRPRQ